jgi:MurNAc alpha-1-phosphate uridylyltransferase
MSQRAEYKGGVEMNAMILAAGMGTRLKPLTDSMPKALVPVKGKPLLQHVLDKLHEEGFDNIVVNVHHFANQIIEYLSGTDVKISNETNQLLDTGGGLKKAIPLFGNDSHILIHNVDILSNVNLKQFYESAFLFDATLLVSWRKTKRYLLFNDDMLLVGWTNIETGEVKSPYQNLDTKKCKLLAFSGIHCISPRLSVLMEQWPDRFPIMDFYLRNCKNIKIKGIERANLRLMDVGKLDTIKEAETFIKTL